MRLAVAQAPADLPTPDARLSWLNSMVETAATSGTDLIMLPELFACGYHIGAKVERWAEPLDGPTFTAVAKLAANSGVAIHYSFAERDGQNIHSSAVCVTPTGEKLGHHRKLAIPPGFERQHYSAGAGCQTFVFGGIRCATLICYDAEFPESVRHIAALGVQLVLVPTALGAQWGWVAKTMIPTRAYENGVYLAYANSAGTQNGFEFLGASFVAAPDGVEIVRAGAQPEILYADIDPSRVGKAQARLPYLADRHEMKFD